MSTVSDYITSPKGEIQFLALNRKVAKDMKPDSVEGYAVRIKFDSTTKEGAKWKEAISTLNPNLIGTKHVDNKNEFTVRAFSKFLPVVLDGQGNELEDMPNFYKDSTGTASMSVVPYTGNSMGGAINLAGITIHDLEVGENTGTSEESAREAVLASLRATLNTK